MGNKNFDKELRLKKGAVQYRLDKMKAGMVGSSAGQPRPYAKKNIATARLFSPLLVGHSLTVTPKESDENFKVGQYYEWKVTEPGFGTIGQYEFDARQIQALFVVKTRR